VSTSQMRPSSTSTYTASLMRASRAHQQRGLIIVEEYYYERHLSNSASTPHMIPIIPTNSVMEIMPIQVSASMSNGMLIQGSQSLVPIPPTEAL
jgi:hypothetical protein